MGRRKNRIKEEGDEERQGQKSEKKAVYLAG
jgi:hypothetical protein